MSGKYHEYCCCFRFYWDQEEIKRISPGDWGFWGFGNYDNEMPGLDNPWKEGNKMAPFDKEVKRHRQMKLVHLYFKRPTI